MTKQEMEVAINGWVDIDKLYEKAREYLAQRIKEDDSFLSEYMDVVEKFKSAKVMYDNLVQDALDANIEETELEQYPDEWISYILRL